MSPAELVRPRMLAAFALAALGGVALRFAPFSLLELLWSLPFGTLLVRWGAPGALAIAAGIGAGRLAAEGDPSRVRRFTVLFSLQALSAVAALNWATFAAPPPFSWLLAMAVSLVVGFFAVVGAAPARAPADTSTAAAPSASAGTAPPLPAGDFTAAVQQGAAALTHPAAPPAPAGSAPAAPLPIRSVREEHLYMDLTPCACGDARREADRSATMAAGEQLFSRFEWACPGCGTTRRFDFLLPEDMAYLSVRAPSYAHGEAPSRLIDAGQWLAVSDRYARSVPAEPSPDPEVRRRAAMAVGEAISAMEEVLKFVPPDPMAEAPASAFWTPAGRSKQAELPGQFRRLGLEARLGAYRDILAKLEQGG